MPNVQFVGGPAEGVFAPARLPDGVLVVNKDANEVALYDTSDPGFVRFREKRPADHARRLLAALEPRWDVLTYDSERMGPW